MFKGNYMFRILLKALSVLIIALIIYSKIYTKGYMALKHDLGYEYEHQRPGNSETQTMDMEQRTTIQNYRIDAGHQIVVPDGQGTTDENHDSYRNDDSYQSALVDNEEKEPYDLRLQTLYEVDYPYKHAVD